jgi:hypothetical protein
MKHLFVFLSVTTLALTSAVYPAEPFAAETPLAAAVERFNAQAKLDPIGKDQPPLTVDETVAAIRGWVRKHHSVTDEYYQAFQKIADTATLPAGSRLDFTTGWKNYNGYDFVVWWVDLTLSPPSPGGSEPATAAGYTYRIRDRKLSCRPATVSDRGKIETRARKVQN